MPAHDSGAAGIGVGGGVIAGGAACAEADRRRHGAAGALGLLLKRDRLARRRGHLARGGIAIGGILGRRLGDDLVEGGHEVGARRAGLRRRVADVRPELGDVAVLGVGDLAGQHLVQDATQRVDVRATVDRVALDLLGGDVVGRPHPEAGPRQASGRARALGQPEVGQVRVGLRGLVGDQDVRRLDVAVHQSARVRGVERAGDLGQDDARHLEREGTAIDHAAQVRPGHEAHREVEHALLLAAAMDGHDVRVLEGRRQARLGPEARGRVLVLHPLGRDQLQRHGAIEIDVHRLVDDAHPAAVEQPVDPVAGEHRAVLEARERRPCVVLLVRHDAPPSRRPQAWHLAHRSRPPRCPPPSVKTLTPMLGARQVRERAVRPGPAGGASYSWRRARLGATRGGSSGCLG